MCGLGRAQRESPPQLNRAIEKDAEIIVLLSECPFCFVPCLAMKDHLPTRFAPLIFALTILKMLWHQDGGFIIPMTICLAFINGLEYIHFES